LFLGVNLTRRARVTSNTITRCFPATSKSSSSRAASSPAPIARNAISRAATPPPAPSAASYTLPFPSGFESYMQPGMHQSSMFMPGFQAHCTMNIEPFTASTSELRFLSDLRSANRYQPYNCYLSKAHCYMLFKSTCYVLSCILCE
jgi:hypothetical protein